MAEDAERSEAQCDVDDILCQMAALSHLKGLKTALGNERYLTEFPELQGLDEKISGREETLRGTLERCGLEPVAEVDVTAPEEE